MTGKPNDVPFHFQRRAVGDIERERRVVSIFDDLHVIFDDRISSGHVPHAAPNVSGTQWIPSISAPRNRSGIEVQFIEILRIIQLKCTAIEGQIDIRRSRPHLHIFKRSTFVDDDRCAEKSLGPAGRIDTIDGIDNESAFIDDHFFIRVA